MWQTDDGHSLWFILICMSLINLENFTPKILFFRCFNLNIKIICKRSLILFHLCSVFIWKCCLSNSLWQTDPGRDCTVAAHYTCDCTVQYCTVQYCSHTVTNIRGGPMGDPGVTRPRVMSQICGLTGVAHIVVTTPWHPISPSGWLSRSLLKGKYCILRPSFLPAPGSLGSSADS